MRIETATDFLATVSEGDVLYQLHSWCAAPTHVERITVTEIERIARDGIYGAEPSLICHYLNAGGRQARMFVDDMLNSSHGVWTDLREAMDYFDERQAAFKTVPELIEERQRFFEMSRRWTRLFDTITEARPDAD